MLCTLCHKNHATVHITEIINHNIKETHICDNCAREQQTKLSASPLEPIAQSLIPSQLEEASRKFADRQCPQCGISLQQFRTKVRFGCPYDYEYFKEVIFPMLEKIHGSSRYRGKVPKGRGSPEMEKEHEIYQLERKLKELVQKEEYEGAAQIRDKIKALREQLTSTHCPMTGQEGEKGKERKKGSDKSEQTE